MGLLGPEPRPELLECPRCDKKMPEGVPEQFHCGIYAGRMCNECFKEAYVPERGFVPTEDDEDIGFMPDGPSDAELSGDLT